MLIAPQQDSRLEPCRGDKALLQKDCQGDQLLSLIRGHLQPTLWSHLIGNGQGQGERYKAGSLALEAEQGRVLR